MKTPRAASPFRTRLPKQIQRALPISIAASLLFVLFLWRHDSFRSSPIVADALKHVLPLQPLSISSHEFPKKIWQLWKVDPFSFEERDLARAKSWTAINPEYRYEVLTDGNDMNYVETHFGRAGLNRLDIVSTYRSLTAKIIKADLLRYLVMYIEGGVYADIDVESIRPIDGFIPPQYNPKDVDLVVGVEIDEPDFKGHRILGPKSQSFCQWTFMAKPRVPVMLKLVDNIVKWLHDVARRQNVPVSEIVLDFDEVISGTGPSAFTNAIMAEISTRSGRAMNWDYFHNLTEPRLIGGVLILTVKAFAAGQGHSNSGNHSSTEVLVKHHYHASEWPKTHPRFKHPVYREVELCNWNTECVKQWDANTAAFESLPKEQQAIMISEAKEQFEKETAEREAAEREAAERESAEREAAQREAADRERAEREAAEREAAEREAAEREAAEKEAANKEATQREQADKDSANKDAGKREEVEKASIGST